MDNPALVALVVIYLAVAAAMGIFLVKSFRKHGLLTDDDQDRFQRARVLVVTLALCWPSTLILGAVASTESGRDFLYRLLGVEDGDR